ALAAIKRVCDRNLGMQEVVLVLDEGTEKKALKMPFRVDADDKFLKDMVIVVGNEHVKVK
ncbi:hypothetical protein IJH89_01680, partial [Candidatus Saccharibacteria bacterium]|nr:hypothetical protein [Candidatus Saccharibacteria bacterium]